MIEVTNATPEEIKGTKDGRNYHFFKQKVILRATDRDGIEEVRTFSVVSDPGETYEPGSDYAISADSCFLARDEKGNDVLRLRRRVKLVRVGAQAAARSPIKVAA